MDETNRESVPPGALEAEGREPYPPVLYRSVHGERSVDKSFYKAVARGANNVLELGCGHGRIAECMAETGARVTGIDTSPESLAEARLRVPNATFIAADMRSFSLDERFERIVCPYNGVYCLLDADDVEAMLRHVHQHLVPGGLFVFDGYAADGFHAQEPDEKESEEAFVRRVNAGGTDWDVYESSLWNRETQRIDAKYLHVPVEGGTPRRAAIPQRYLLRTQVEALLARSGLELLVVHGDFDQSAWDEDSPFLIVTAQRPFAEA